MKPRTEKKVAAFCKLYGIPCFLPLRHCTRTVQRRRVTTKTPLFPGYLFVRMDEKQRLRMLETNLLVRVLVPSRPRQMLRDLIMVRRALRANPTLETQPLLSKGRMVRIISGPFQGVEGRITRMASSVKVTLNVEMIGQAVAIIVESTQLEPLPHQ